MASPKKSRRGNRSNHPHLAGSAVTIRRERSFSRSTKRIISNVFHNAAALFPDATVKARTAKVANLTGISICSVYNIRRELSQKGRFAAPKRKQKCMNMKKSSSRRLDLDNFQLTYLRRIVHDFIRENNVPTVRKVLEKIHEDTVIPKISRTSLHNVLKQLGFKYEKNASPPTLIERDDITAWRRRYLRYIRNYRRENRHIYYLDETWINEGECFHNSWHGTTIKTEEDAVAKQVFLSGTSTGSSLHTGEGKRLIVAHIGSVDGFVPDAHLVLKAVKSDGNYQQEMNESIFQKWMEKVFPKLKPGSVIVMDNAPHHTVQIERSPTNTWKKGDLLTWLNNKGISVPPNALKAELLEIAYAHKDVHRTYVIDERAKALGFRVLRLPPYHSTLNPIEMVWSQMKHHVRLENHTLDVQDHTYKLAELQPLLISAIAKITSENWQNYVNRVITTEDEFWALDDLVEELIEPVNFQVNTGDSDSSDSSESEDDMSEASTSWINYTTQDTFLYEDEVE